MNVAEDEITVDDEEPTLRTAEGLARRLEDAVERSMNDLATERSPRLAPPPRGPGEIATERPDTGMGISLRR